MPFRSCQWLLEGLAAPAMLVDFDGRVVAANRAAGAVVGEPLRACLGDRPDAEEIVAVAQDDAVTPGHAREFVAAEGPGATVVRAGRLAADGAVLTLVTVEPLVSDADLAARYASAAEALQRARVARHEINNQLMGLLGHAELLADAPELSPASRRRLEAIVEQARRIRDHVDTLRRETTPDAS